jgi:hypothetical protein
MYFRILIIFALVFFGSCSDPETKNLAPVADFESADELDEIKLLSNSSDPDGDQLRLTWTSADLQDVTHNQYLNIKLRESAFTTNVTLTASDGKTEQSVTHAIAVPALSPVRSLGLGKALDQEASNNANYEWYLDQGGSGQFSNVNCGPASVTMAIKWANADFPKTVEDARKTFRSEGGWWYTNDIQNYLAQNNINNWVMSLNTMADLKNEIDNGNIAILCLDMYYISKSKKLQYHVDKFYSADSPGWGHFIVIKGYKQVDDNTFFEAYDPYSFGVIYDDHTVKGKNRFYRSADLDQSTQIWWDYAIIISKNSNGRIAGRGVTPATQAKGK